MVVPARDEEDRIARCLEALAAQEGVERPGVVLVLDGCADATAEVARASAARTGLALELLDGPGRGVGHARRLGMRAAAARLRPAAAPGHLDATALGHLDAAALGHLDDPAGRGHPDAAALGHLDDPAAPPGARVGDGSAPRRAGPPPASVLASTDADSVVAPDWLARTLAHVDAGAQAVGGRIRLDPREAARLPPGVLAAREAEAERRLAAVRRHAPEAEHHQFSGASLALTLAAHDAVGGIPAVTALEDEALERALRAAGFRIAYAADVRVTTSARTDGRVPRGLAQVLRAATWQSGGTARPRRAAGALARPAAHAVTLVGAAGQRGSALHAVRAGAGGIVLALGAGVEAAQAAPLVEALRADPALLLVRAAEPHPDPLAELVARPALNLHAPELAVLASPLTRTWAARRELLAGLALPHGDAADLTVLVDTWRGHGLAAVAERRVAAPAPAPRADPPLAAYELMAALAARFEEPPALSSAFADADGTRRALLDEHPPRARAAPGPGARPALARS